MSLQPSGMSVGVLHSVRVPQRNVVEVENIFWQWNGSGFQYAYAPALSRTGRILPALQAAGATAHPVRPLQMPAPFRAQYHHTQFEHFIQYCANLALNQFNFSSTAGHGGNFCSLTMLSIWRRLSAPECWQRQSGCPRLRATFGDDFGGTRHPRDGCAPGEIANAFDSSSGKPPIHW